ncbi:hypothetical protein ACFOZY_00065 [Chungangia koreensis]|uniref:Uncharacterized protein n=1 Tax=Chungangia koreensis TaxID=752657 RepID=A0ABV8X3K6_9LACT
MEKSTWKSSLLKILWVIGLIVLTSLSYNVENQLNLIAKATFNPFPVLWVKPILSIIFGLYLSLIFIKKWSVKLNATLLWCVAIPCLLLSFLYPFLVTVSIGNPPFFIGSLIDGWIFKMSSFEVLGIVTGLTLMLSVFGQPKMTVSHENYLQE